MHGMRWEGGGQPCRRARHCYSTIYGGCCLLLLHLPPVGLLKGLRQRRRRHLCRCCRQGRAPLPTAGAAAVPQLGRQAYAESHAHSAD